MKLIAAADAAIGEKKQYQSARAIFLLAVIFAFANVFADYFGYAGTVLSVADFDFFQSYGI